MQEANSHNHGIDRRNEILDAAEAVFSERGYAATTIELVAERAKIAKGSIYNYFDSKRALFISVFTRTISRQDAAALAVIDSPAPAGSRVEGLLDFWFARLGQSRAMTQLGMEFWATAAREDSAGELTRTFNQLYSQWRDRLSGLFEQGVRSGEFAPNLNTLAAASLMLAILDGIEVQSAVGLGVVVDAELITSLKAAALAALKAGPGQPTAKQELHS